jgi:hypothetical protein
MLSEGVIARVAGSDRAPPVGLKYHFYYGSRASWTQLGPEEICFNEQPPGDFNWQNNNTVLREVR